MRILQHMRSHVRSYMFSYNRYPYNCASVQRALLAPEILNELFQKCRYFTALLGNSSQLKVNKITVAGSHEMLVECDSMQVGLKMVLEPDIP